MSRYTLDLWHTLQIAASPASLTRLFGPPAFDNAIDMQRFCNAYGKTTARPGREYGMPPETALKDASNRNEAL